MKAQWKEARHILCVRLDYLGDVLMCTPAIKALKSSIPDSHITLLTSGSGAAAAPYIPQVDEAIVYAAPWMKSSEPHGVAADFAFMSQLRERHFDAAVIFTTYSQSSLPAAMMCYLAGIPLRLAHCHENPYQLLTDWIPDPEPGTTIRHEVQRQLDLVASIGCTSEDQGLVFTVQNEDKAWISRRLQSLGIGPDRRWVLCHPGATAASRRYPAAYWAEAVRQLHHQSDVSIVMTGSVEESELIDEICSTACVPSISLAGELSLGQLGAAISLASLVISNNTGPAHIAAAVGTPIVDLYALTNPQHTPWMVRSEVLFHDVPCRFCYKSVCPQGHHHCLSKLEPAEVVRAAQRLLKPNSYRQKDHHGMLAEQFMVSRHRGNAKAGPGPASKTVHPLVLIANS